MVPDTVFAYQSNLLVAVLVQRIFNIAFAQDIGFLTIFDSQSRITTQPSAFSRRLFLRSRLRLFSKLACCSSTGSLVDLRLRALDDPSKLARTPL